MRVIIGCLVCFSFISTVHNLPNIIFVLADDQDVLLGSLTPMEKTIKLIANEGITLENSFVNTPVCCPSRSTILTGKYLHNTGVRNNSISGNCSSSEWQNNHEIFSITSILKQEKDYRTFYAGKYLNEYGYPAAGGTEHVPIGYDWWIGLRGNSVYYNYVLSINGSSQSFTDSYLTDLIHEYALDFLNQNDIKTTPFFMTLATPACHAPFTPAPRHENAYPDVEVSRTPSFNYTPTDKHWLVNTEPAHLPEDVSILDDIHRNRFRTLLAVDEMVEAVFNKLVELDILNNTYIIFTSDHGYHIGQFGQPWDKREPYNTDLRIPFFIRGPSLDKNLTLNAPISAVDFAPTILDLAGIEIPDYMDGQSFKDILTRNSSNTNTESRILIEYFGEGDSNTNDNGCPSRNDNTLSQCRTESWCKCQDSRNNTYSCVLYFQNTESLKFCAFSDNDNFVEAYDIFNDPYDLNNLFQFVTPRSALAYRNLLDYLKNCKGASCRMKLDTIDVINL